MSENGLTDGFHLCGHSMGGYLAALYAFERPERIQSLMLASPVGLPSLPDEAFRLPLSETPWQLRVVNWLWSSYATPMQIVRLAGFKGPALVNSIIARRFSALDWNEQKTKVRAADEHCASCASSPRVSNGFSGFTQVVGDYMFHITAAPPSGEYALTDLLTLVLTRSREQGSGVYARRSLLDVLLTPSAGPSFSLRVAYGDHDWMYHAPSCQRAVEQLRAAGWDASLTILSNAGHHLYLDNVEEFTAFCRVPSFGLARG